MEGSARSTLERDDTGFVSLLALRDTAQRLSADEFAQALPHPTLISTAPDPQRDPLSESGRLEISYMRTMISAASDTPRPGSIAIASGFSDRVAVLAKRPGNPFPKVISVGRAMSNDVVFLRETVSKLQGYFTRDEARGAWEFTDQHSSNGTLLGQNPLDPGRAYSLRSGDRLRFGLEVEVFFLMPAALRSWLLTPVAP